MNKTQANSIIRQTRDNYNTIADEWDRSRSEPTELKKKMLKTSKKMLDLGCGNGLIIPQAIKKTQYYIGLDISKKLIIKAKKRYNTLIKTKQVRLLVGDARKLPFEDESFDFVISYAMLHHLPLQEYRQDVLNEVYRVLSPGGKAVFINWNLFNSWAEKRFGVKDQMLRPATSLEKGDLLIPWKATNGKLIKRFLHVFTPEELKKLSYQAGFKNPKVYYYNRAGQVVENGEEIVLKIEKSD